MQRHTHTNTETNTHTDSNEYPIALKNQVYIVENYNRRLAEIGSHGSSLTKV